MIEIRLTTVNDPSHTRNVPETTGARGESRNNVRRTSAIARFFFVRMPSITFYGWALVGVRLRTPVASIAGLSTLPCACPPRLRADGGPSIKMEAAMRANTPARSEQSRIPLLPKVANDQLVSRFLVESTEATDIRDAPSIGDVISTRLAGRIGTVTHVYPDGSASVRWHDNPSIAEDLDHERVPRRSFAICSTSDIRTICIKAIQAAAMAPTVFDALDAAGAALRLIAEMSAGEVRHG